MFFIEYIYVYFASLFFRFIGDYVGSEDSIIDRVLLTVFGIVVYMIVDILVFPVTTKKTVRLYVLKCMNEVSYGLKNSSEAVNRIHHLSLLEKESSSKKLELNGNLQNSKKVSSKLSDISTDEKTIRVSTTHQSSKVSEEEQKSSLPTLSLPDDVTNENNSTTPTTPSTLIQTIGTNISNTLAAIRPRRSSTVVEPPPSPVTLSPEQSFANTQQTIDQNIHQLEVELGMIEVNFYDNDNNNLGHTIQSTNENIPISTSNPLPPAQASDQKSDSQSFIEEFPTKNDTSTTIQKDLSECEEFIKQGEIAVISLNKYTKAIDSALNLAVHEPAIIKRFLFSNSFINL